MNKSIKNTNEINKSFFNNKFKYIVSLFITLVGILSLVGGTSYAILKGNTSSSKEQVIKTGSIKLKLTENFENMNKKIMIMSDSDGLLQADVYEFNLKNIGDSPAKYDLKLVNEVPSDYTGNVLDTKYIKIGLEINGEEYGPFSLEDVNNIIDSNIIYENEIINYTLRIWLDEGKEEELHNKEDYKLFLKVKVEAEQRTGKQEQASASNSVYSWSKTSIFPGVTLESISGYTTDYTTLNKTFFLKHNIGSDNTVESQEVCYILNSEVYCLMGYEANYYEANKTTLLESFGEENCTVDSIHVYCSASGLSADAFDYGAVSAYVGHKDCNVDVNGYADCNESEGSGGAN